MKKRFKNLQLQQLSEKLALAQPLRQLQAPRSGWIKAIRLALDMPQSYLATRLGVAQTGIAKYETGEKEGTIRIATLRKVADALNCDFIYAFVPRGSLEQIRVTQAKELARRIVNSVAITMALEDQAVPQEDQEKRIVELARTILEESPKAIWQI